MQYSFKKGLVKGATSTLAIAGAMVAFAGFSDLTIWSLVEQYLKPVLSGLSVGAAITMVSNYIKVKYTV